MKNNTIFFNEKMSNWLFWVISFVLFLPIIVLPPNFQPSEWSRSILFRVITTALICFLFYRFFYKKNLSIFLPKWKLSLWTPFLILTAFFATVILATIFSEDIRFSIFGSPIRAGGTLNLLYYFIFSVILALLIRKNQWQKLFNILFVIGFLSSLLAIVQYFNILKNIFVAYEGGSTPSFMGNSTILAMYMLFLVFLSFVLFIQKQKRKEKILYGILFFLFVFTIFITGSRAAYLGLLIGFFYFFLFYPLKKLPAGTNSPQNYTQTPESAQMANSNNIFASPRTWIINFFNENFEVKLKTIKKIAIFVLLFSMLAVIFFNFFPQLGEKNSFFKIITTRVSVASIAKDVAGTRLSAWKMTLEAIKDKPILGFGPENFYIGFEKYYDPTPFTTSVLLWDRPHNILLDIAANSGIFSLLLYMAFWIALFWQLQKAKNSNYDADRTLKAHGLQAMFIGYLIVLFFNFDSFATYLISFFFVGYAFYLIFLPVEKIEILPSTKRIALKNTSVIILLLLVILFLWFWNIKPLHLGEKIAHAKNLSKEGQCKKAFGISNKEHWEKSGIIRSYAILQYADIVKSCAFIEPEKEVEYSQKMVSLLKTATNAQPKFSRTWLFMASFTNVLAAREETADVKNNLLQEARGYLQKALALSPKRQEPFVELGKNYLIAQDYQAMKSMSNDCITIDTRFGECYFYLGLAQIFLNEQEEGKKNIDLAIANSYTPIYKQLAVAYMSQKNWRDALLSYQKVRPADEKSASASYYAVLAFLYEKVGDYQKAGESALEVFKLQPENPETVIFIKLLLGKKPNDAILNSSLAFIYEQPGPEQKISEAKAIYLALIKSYPENIQYRWKLTEVYYGQKEYDLAYEQAIAIMETDSHQRDNAEYFFTKMPKSYYDRWKEWFKTKYPS